MEGMSFKGLIDTWSWTLIVFVGARVLFVFVAAWALLLKKPEKQKWLLTNMQASRFGKVWARKQTARQQQVDLHLHTNVTRNSAAMD